MKIKISECTEKEIDLNFSITSVTEKSVMFGDNPVVGIWMTVNDKTFNCVNSLRCFKDAESAWSTLEPTIRTLINNCYGAENEM